MYWLRQNMKNKIKFRITFIFIFIDREPFCIITNNPNSTIVERYKGYFFAKYCTIDGDKILINMKNVLYIKTEILNE